MSRYLTVEKVEGKPGQVYYPLKLNTCPIPAPGPKQILLKLHAASVNHRDLFIRQHLYPAISFSTPLFADGVGTVVSASPDCVRGKELVGKTVLPVPCTGWNSSPLGPDDEGQPFSILGSSKLHPAGMGTEFLVVSEDAVEPAPAHLSMAEAAALPLVGLTGWRALVSKAGGAGLQAGANVLVTGIGGGVALQVLQFGVAMGMNVWVTSSSPGKVEKAVAMGAKGGVLYSSKTWEKDLAAKLPAERPYLDAVVDGAGGDIIPKTVKILKHGGVVAQYGMTLGPRMEWNMAAVLKNIELRGTTMGSRREFREMVEFVRETRIRPAVSSTVKGLDNLEGINGLFEEMKRGGQFGKLVVEFGGGGDTAGAEAKL